MVGYFAVLSISLCAQHFAVLSTLAMTCRKIVCDYFVRVIAEEVRFELTIPFGIPVFETGALGLYATPPVSQTLTFFCVFGKNRLECETFLGPIV